MKNTLRRMQNNVAMTACFGSALLALLPLLSILLYITTRGLSSLNVEFFTHLPKPVGEVGGGMANAIVGTIIIVGLACVWAVPVGVFGGVYISEFADRRSATIIRFTADVLTGVPSIVIGMFAYSLFVLPLKSFSALSGSFALGMILIPPVIRTTEEMVKTVPVTLREAALALGINRFRTTLSIVMRTAAPGIVTGILLAMARIAGETAPLLFTAFGNRVWNLDLMHPMAALPLQIFVYAISPYEDWHRQAWAGALILILMVLAITLLSRWWTSAQRKSLQVRT
jgi:phosphate transport system permease protein